MRCRSAGIPKGTQPAATSVTLPVRRPVTVAKVNGNVRVRRVPPQLLFELRNAVLERVQIGNPSLDRVELLRQTQQPLQQRAAPWTLRIDGGQILGHPALLPRPACRGITTVHAPATHT